jgi:hypothetical protein
MIHNGPYCILIWDDRKDKKKILPTNVVFFSFNWNLMITMAIKCNKLSSLKSVCLGQPSLKNSKNQGIYLAHNTLLGLKELMYSWPITYCH